MHERESGMFCLRNNKSYWTSRSAGHRRQESTKRWMDGQTAQWSLTVLHEQISCDPCVRKFGTTRNLPLTMTQITFSKRVKKTLWKQMWFRNKVVNTMPLVLYSVQHTIWRRKTDRLQIIVLSSICRNLMALMLVGFYIGRQLALILSTIYRKKCAKQLNRCFWIQMYRHVRCRVFYVTLIGKL